MIILAKAPRPVVETPQDPSISPETPERQTLICFYRVSTSPACGNTEELEQKAHGERGVSVFAVVTGSHQETRARAKWRMQTLRRAWSWLRFGLSSSLKEWGLYISPQHFDRDEEESCCSQRAAWRVPDYPYPDDLLPLADDAFCPPQFQQMLCQSHGMAIKSSTSLHEGECGDRSGKGKLFVLSDGAGNSRAVSALA